MERSENFSIAIIKSIWIESEGDLMIRLYKSQTLGHIYKIAKKTPKQHFEGNMTKMSVIIYPYMSAFDKMPEYQHFCHQEQWQLSHDSPLTLSAPDCGVNK